MIPPDAGRGTAREASGGGGSTQARRPEVHAARKLRRQHPIGPHVVDFFAPAARLVVEVNGDAHGRGERPARDDRRDAFLRENGFAVMHIPTSGVLQDPDAVAASIVALASRPLHQPAAGPPPRSGEDQV